MYMHHPRAPSLCSERRQARTPPTAAVWQIRTSAVKQGLLGRNRSLATPNGAHTHSWARNINSRCDRTPCPTGRGARAGGLIGPKRPLYLSSAAAALASCVRRPMS
eukprot:scaffold28931_cov107-Isochrysis_galbana.AAC.1